MASQDLFADSDYEINSQVMSFSQLLNSSDSQLINPDSQLLINSDSDIEKPLSDGMEDLIQKELEKQDGIDLKVLTNVYYPGDGIGSGWSLSQNSDQMTQGFNMNVYQAGPVAEVADIPQLPPGFVYDGAHQFMVGKDVQGLSLSQSSTNSVDDGIPSMEPWKGEYNFGFTLEQGTTRKFAFSTYNNKLFCLPNQEIEFFFTYDYLKCKSSDMYLTASMRYTKPDCAALPVLRCLQHESEDKTKLEQQAKTAPEQIKLVAHVMKCSQKKTEYRQDPKTGRCSVKMPVGHPQSGNTKVNRLFKFDCLNSCKPRTGHKKCPVAVVFELLERIVGRIVLNVRVCSCPVRDFLKEEPTKKGVPVVGLPVLAKKRKSAEASVKVEADERPEFGGRASDEIKRSRKREDGDDVENELEIAAKSRRISDVQPQLLLIPKVELPPVDTELDPFLSSSQESHCSDEDLRELSQTKLEKFKALQKMAKWVLKLSFSQNSILNQLGRNFAKDIRKQIKFASLVLESSQKKPSADVCNESARSESPDSGINVADGNKRNSGGM